jgi:hypothetical protein
MGESPFAQFQSQGSPRSSNIGAGKDTPIRGDKHTELADNGFNLRQPDESLKSLTSPDGNQQPEPKALSINTDSRK